MIITYINLRRLLNANQEEERRYIRVSSRLPALLAIEDIERIFAEHVCLLGLPCLEEHFYRLASHWPPSANQCRDPDQVACQRKRGDHESARGTRVSVLKFSLTTVNRPCGSRISSSRAREGEQS